MFVEEHRDLPVPLAEAADRLSLGLLGGSVQRLSADAYQHGLGVLERIGPHGAEGLLAKEVRLQTLPAYRRGATLVTPLRWMPTGPLGGLFPEFDGNLELTPLDAWHTRFTLVGSYRPPSGAVGAWLDRLLLHRAAQSTLASFLDRLRPTLLDSPAPRAASTCSNALTVCPDTSASR